MRSATCFLGQRSVLSFHTVGGRLLLPPIDPTAGRKQREWQGLSQDPHTKLVSAPRLLVNAFEDALRAAALIGQVMRLDLAFGGKQTDQEGCRGENGLALGGIDR